MDASVFNLVKQQSPKFNVKVCEGLAYHDVRNTEQYVDLVFRCAQRDLPEGLEYRGYAHTSPKEECAQSVYSKNSKHMLDISRSDSYMEKFLFTWQGEDIRPIYLALPIVSRGNLLKLRDSDFTISPVIVDNALSVSSNQIYVPMNKSKLTFKRKLYGFKVDGIINNSYIIYSRIFRAKDKSPKKRSSNMITSCTHYLFSKYGLTETFSRFANCEIHVGENLSETDFPRSEWAICESTGIVPKDCTAKYEQSPKVQLAIRHADRNLTTEGMISSFFYILDHFPKRTSMELMEWDNPISWLLLLGLILMYTTDNETSILNLMKIHMTSVDSTVDGMVQGWLESDGIFVNDIYEFLFYMVDNFNNIVATSAKQQSTMYGKKLTVLRYVLMDIIIAIFNMTFELQADKNKQISKKDIELIMRKSLKPILIHKINGGHPEVSTVSCPSECMIPKITSLAKMQDDMSVGSSKAIKKINASTVLDASIAEVGSLTHNTKSDPTGRSSLNPCLQLTDDGYIKRHEELRDIIDETQEKIAR